jgi:ferredoxin
MPRPKNDVIPIIDKEKCTGCGLCTIDCPTKALVISQMSEKETYQLLFLKETCNACGVCETSCPENCLQLVEKGPDRDRIGNPAAEQRSIISNGVNEAKVIFEDKISRCMECGIPLFPQAMVKRLESKILVTKESTWPFHLCPSCRIKSQFKAAMFEKMGS